MSYKPPSARMHQINYHARRKPVPEPENVQEAVAQIPWPEIPKDPPVIEPEVFVGVDLGTVTEPEAPVAPAIEEAPAPEVSKAAAETPVAEPEPTPAAALYDDKMTKAELKAVAVKLGIEISGNKIEMLKQLDEHFQQ